jgi:hypothetical protein
MLIAFLQYSKVLPNFQRNAEENKKMITYSRYYYYKKELDFAVKVEKNVYFDTNLSAYDSFRENTENLSPSQLLINFFKFYSDTSRNYSKFAIDISDPNGPFVSKEDYFKKL